MSYENIHNVLPQKIRPCLERMHVQFEALQEIRLRAGKPLMVLYKGKELILTGKDGQPYVVTQEDIQEMMEYTCNYSMYAYEQEMKQGFITIEGGHRVGLSGQVIIENEKVKNLKYISSVNMRISHEIMGCADPVLPYITQNKQLCHTLIISPPGCGKTTLLRDIIRQVSEGNTYIRGVSVGVVDERSEIGGCYMGIAQNHLGMRTDIMDCCPKAEGMIMLIRSMRPQVIAVDEIGTDADVRALEYAMHCGCKLLATVHGASVEEVRTKPGIERIIQENRFERFIVLENTLHAGAVEGIYNSDLELLYTESLEEAVC